MMAIASKLERIDYRSKIKQEEIDEFNKKHAHVGEICWVDQQQL